jgi:hypothetical protein
LSKVVEKLAPLVNVVRVSKDKPTNEPAKQPPKKTA